MSALSAIAEKPGRVEKMFVNSNGGQINHEGVYGINMYALGVPHTVLVDDFLAGNYEGSDFQPAFAELAGDRSVWTVIVEKAFAKLHGNY